MLCDGSGMVGDSPLRGIMVCKVCGDTRVATSGYRFPVHPVWLGRNDDEIRHDGEFDRDREWVDPYDNQTPKESS